MVAARVLLFLPFFYYFILQAWTFPTNKTENNESNKHQITYMEYNIFFILKSILFIIYKKKILSLHNEEYLQQNKTKGKKKYDGHYVQTRATM